MAYFLGMDAGGTNTFAIITDEAGHVAGIGKSGNGNHQIHKREAESNIIAAVMEALDQAHLSLHELTYSWFGLAGADREFDMRILHPIIEKLGVKNYTISCDTHTALKAGTHQPSGVIVICGTGVNCAGIDENGTYFQCGGFGYPYGDFGGGSGLSMEVFRAVIRAWEGRGEETVLTSLLLQRLNYDTVSAMFHDFLDHSKSVPADVAKLLFMAADKKDEVARKLLQQQGYELGLAAKAVVKRLQLEEKKFEVVLAGSVLTKGKNELIQQEIAKAVYPMAPNSSIVYLEQEPVVGALLLAMEEAGYEVTADTYRNLATMTEIEVG